MHSSRDAVARNTVIRRRVSCAVALSAALLIASACDKGASDADTAAAVRTDSAGVEIVLSQGDDRPLSWVLEPVAEIRSDSAGAGLFNPSADLVRTDAAGRIYILDRDANRILVFDDKGKLLRTEGRKGGGPGEMDFPISFAVSSDGTAAVFDISKHHIVRWGPAGEVLPELEVGNFFGGRMYVTGDSVLHDFTSNDVASGTATGGIRWSDGGGNVMAADAGEPVFSYDLPPFKPIELKSCGMGFSGMPPIFSPAVAWDATGGRVAFARQDVYDVHLRENGRDVRRIRRDVTPVEATKELAVRELGDGMKVRTNAGMRVCQTDEVVEQRGIAPTLPLVRNIALSPDGELWVRRGGISGDPAPIDVFAADGAYIGTLPPTVPFPAAFLPDDRIVAVDVDEDDLGHARIYKVKR
jgi:hypothetical protein